MEDVAIFCGERVEGIGKESRRFFPLLEMRNMARVKAGQSDEQLLARLVAMITGNLAMPRGTTEVRKAKRRVEPQRIADPRLSQEIYESHQTHAREKTCVCGCGGVADSASRGRTLEHYEQFRAAKHRAGDPVAYDHFMQLRGLIFQPYFNPDKSYRDYAAEKDFEEKQRKRNP